MSEFEALQSDFLATIVAYQNNETEAYAATTLGMMDGEEVTFIIESDYDTLYFRIGVPLAAFDTGVPRRNIMHVKHLGGATVALQRAILKRLLRQVNLDLALQSTTQTHAIYGDTIPLVVDGTTA